uniref:Uncharacterized protein n=1 Tax=Anguilla anguilla TaxID=7936 RepID=A0A0E9U5E0_ANGAN
MCFCVHMLTRSVIRPLYCPDRSTAALLARLLHVRPLHPIPKAAVQMTQAWSSKVAGY